MRVAFTACILFLATAAPAGAQDFVADTTISGTWFNPQRSGEGWMIQVANDTTVVIDWLTYPPPDSSDEQAWIFATGRLEGDRIIVDEAFTVEGLDFTSQVALGEIPLTPWGSYTMQFSDCDHGLLSYDGPDGYGSGTIDIQRITGIAGLDCDADAKALAGDTLAEQAAPGSWVHPDRLGQGWLLENSGDGLTLMTWFTHRNGRPAWLFGQGFFDRTSLTMFDVLITRGGEFGPGFDPSMVERIRWGDLQMRFDDCGQGTMLFNSELEDFGSSAFTFSRASGLSNLECDDLASQPVPARASGSWSSVPALPTPRSEVAVASIGASAYVYGGFGSNGRALERFDADTGSWTVLPDAPVARDHAMLAAHGGRLYLFGGNGDLAAAAFVFDPQTAAWDRIADVPRPRSAGQAVTIGSRIYLVGGTFFGSPPLTLAYHVDEDRYDELPPAPGSRDHTNAVAFDGEIWLLGGRSDGEAHGNVAIFNPVTRQWRSGPSMGSPHSGFAAAVLDGQIHVGGGETFGGEARTIGVFEVYSPDDGWRQGPPLPTPVHGVQAAALNGKVYLFGGAHIAGATSPSGVATQVYTPR